MLTRVQNYLRLIRRISVNSYQYLNRTHSQASMIGGVLGGRHQQVVDGVTTNYTLDLAAGLTQVLDDGTNTYLYGNGRISQADSTTEYFLGDALGSVRQLTNPAATITLTQSYAPYGEVTQSVGTSQTSYAFTGESRDANGLTYLRARYYAPQDGRFISRDTWSGNYNRPLSLNRWSYVENNPINFVDPSGKAPIYPPGSLIDELPITLLDPRSLGYYAGENVDLLPYLFYANPYDFSMTASIRFTPPEGSIASQRAIEVLRFIIFNTLIIGKIDIEVYAIDNITGINRVEFYINEEYQDTDEIPPYGWTWDQFSILFPYTIRVVAYDNAGNEKADSKIVWKFG